MCCPAYAANGCPGTILAAVAAHKLSQGKPACCRVCNRRYKVPHGAERTNNNNTRNGNGMQAKQLAEQAKQIADLQKQLASKSTTDANTSNATKAESGAKMDVKKLQTIIDNSKEANLPATIIADLEKQLQEAKEQEATQGNDLNSVLRKLKSAEAHCKQMADQVSKDQERLKKTNEKALEPTSVVCKLREEKKRLLVAEGYKAEPVAIDLVKGAPEVPKEANEQQRKQWESLVQEAKTAQEELANKLHAHLQDFAKNIAATLPPQEKDDQDMAPAPGLPEDTANKNRKANDGRAVPGAPAALSEQQRQEQEQQQAQMQQQKLDDLHEQAEQHLAGLLAQASQPINVRAGDDDDKNMRVLTGVGVTMLSILRWAWSKLALPSVIWDTQGPTRMFLHTPRSITSVSSSLSRSIWDSSSLIPAITITMWWPRGTVSSGVSRWALGGCWHATSCVCVIAPFTTIMGGGILISNTRLWPSKQSVLVGLELLPGGPSSQAKRQLHFVYTEIILVSKANILG